MELIKECKICGCKDFKFLYKQHDKNFDFPEEFDLYKCGNCHTIFINPQLSPKELKKHYPKDYYAFSKIKTKEESMKVRLRILLYDFYYGKLGGNSLMKIICLPIKFLVRGTQVSPGKKILDIGCGSGQFLYEMEECGLDVYGIEPGKINKSKFNIQPDLIKAKYNKETFDLVTMNHVLQHVENPEEMIKEVHNVLKQYGFFIVSASNTRSLAYFLFRKNWFQLDIPRHFVNYPDETLIKLLEKSGFIVMKNRHNSRPNQFVMSLFFLMGIKNRNKILNRVLEIVFLPLTWIVNLFKCGDQVEIWCIKK